MKFERHEPKTLGSTQSAGGRLRAPDVPHRARRPAQLRTRPATDDAALPGDPPEHARRHKGESVESVGAEGTLIHHAPARAMSALVVAMIEAAFRTLLMPPARRADRRA